MKMGLELLRIRMEILKNTISMDIQPKKIKMEKFVDLLNKVTKLSFPRMAN